MEGAGMPEFTIYDEIACIARKALGMLAAQPQAQPPQGYVLVPREPTPAMCREGFLTGDNGFSLDQPADAPGLVYRAMIAAAPQPPAPAQTEPIK
jgi:hypothetical protein